MFIVRVATSTEHAVHEIEHFYSNYVGFEIKGDRGIMSVRRTPTPEQLVELSAAVPLFDGEPGYRVESESTISFNFDGHNYVNLRLVIDQVNGWERLVGGVAAAQEVLRLLQAAAHSGELSLEFLRALGVVVA